MFPEFQGVERCRTAESQAEAEIGASLKRDKCVIEALGRLSCAWSPGRCTFHGSLNTLVQVAVQM